MHSWKLETYTEVRSPPAWSMPHSTVKLSPLDVTMVPSEAGQDGPVPAVAPGVLELLVLLLAGTSAASGLTYRVRRLPAPQYCRVLFAQVKLQSLDVAICPGALMVLPQ